MLILVLLPPGIVEMVDVVSVQLLNFLLQVRKDGVEADAVRGEGDRTAGDILLGALHAGGFDTWSRGRREDDDALLLHTTCVTTRRAFASLSQLLRGDTRIISGLFGEDFLNVDWDTE